MYDKNNWTLKAKPTITQTKHILSALSMNVRGDQFNIFTKLFKPSRSTRILDVGPTSDETLKDSNMFEKLYPYKKNLTLATIEDQQVLKKLYPKTTVKKITPGKRLPFKNNQFDVVVSWATIEHVGGYKDQEFFLSELCRVGKKVFLTTPYRGCPYEPHSGVWFIHWLPLIIFRNFCKAIGKGFWSKESNLNPLLAKDIKKMSSKKITTKIYKLFGILPSHLIITVK
jgi:hypothetical protein